MMERFCTLPHSLLDEPTAVRLKVEQWQLVRTTVR